jgi:ankyrin repeat protein
MDTANDRLFHNQYDDIDIDMLDLHEECRKRCRSSIIRQYIERYPESLTKANREENLPLHMLLHNEASTIEDVLMMIEKYPAALLHKNNRGKLPLHIECMNQCRSSIISKCIELYPELHGRPFVQADWRGYLPLHFLLENYSSTVEDGLMMIEKYPAGLEEYLYGYLPLHIECKHRCRSSIIAKCIELYPEASKVVDDTGNMPLHWLLWNEMPTIDDVLMVIKLYPPALRHQDEDGQLPLHIECRNQCRSPIISKCIEVYPQGLEIADQNGYLPLHELLRNESSSIESSLLVLEKYPQALQHRGDDGFLPFYIECSKRARPAILMKCLRHHPEALNDDTVFLIMTHINKRNYREYASVLSIIFTAYPMSLYEFPETYLEDDIRKYPYMRRKILNLLPRFVFTASHESDYRDLNWQPRAAIMMLLSQMMIQQRSRRQQEVELDINAAAALHVGQPYIIEDDADDIILGFHQRYLLLHRIIKTSTLILKESVEGRSVRNASLSICHHADIGDIFLRSIIAFL